MTVLVEDLLQRPAHRDHPGALVERKEQPLVGETAQPAPPFVGAALGGLWLLHSLLNVDGGHLVPAVAQQPAR
ncbi:hypothetical protein ACFHWS_16090 [Micromonospora sp. LOL_013]|uniref:hypothetical protein n=1 Tax=Micromonospora sp. LOL_013 TaxID=3345414 RepID=UPI003A883EF9